MIWFYKLSISMGIHIFLSLFSPGISIFFKFSFLLPLHPPAQLRLKYIFHCNSPFYFLHCSTDQANSFHSFSSFLCFRVIKNCECFPHNYGRHLRDQ